MTKEKAIEYLKRADVTVGREIKTRTAEALEMAIKAIEESRWIPVTERLPEEGERVLATHLGGIDTNRQVIEHIYENGEFTCNWYMDMDITSPTFGQRLMGDVIAWMPLPKPYEGSEKNDIE